MSQSSIEKSATVMYVCEIMAIPLYKYILRSEVQIATQLLGQLPNNVWRVACKQLKDFCMTHYSALKWTGKYAYLLIQNLWKFNLP